MAAQIDQDACTGCGLCMEVCPVEAISLKDGKAKVDEDQCTECGACSEECPTHAIRIP